MSIILYLLWDDYYDYFRVPCFDPQRFLQCWLVYSTIQCGSYMVHHSGSEGVPFSMSVVGSAISKQTESLHVFDKHFETVIILGIWNTINHSVFITVINISIFSRVIREIGISRILVSFGAICKIFFGWWRKAIFVLVTTAYACGNHQSYELHIHAGTK